MGVYFVLFWLTVLEIVIFMLIIFAILCMSSAVGHISQTKKVLHFAYTRLGRSGITLSINFHFLPFVAYDCQYCTLLSFAASQSVFRIDHGYVLFPAHCKACGSFMKIN